MGKVTKNWKTDGEEDKKLQNLITNGKVNKYTTPKQLQKDYPDVFGSFSPQVMRNHLNSAKRINGLYLETEEDNELSEIQEKRDVKEDEIPRASTSAIDCIGTGVTGSMQQNYPIIVKQFICPDTQTEKVLVVMTLPGGAQNVGVELHEDGKELTIKYTWPKIMYNVEDLFRKKLQFQGIHAYHPMILCFQNGLEQVRPKIDVAPDGIIKVALPVKVQTSIESWEKWGAKRDDGSHVILAVFSCFVKDYVKKRSDELVVYD